MLHTSTDQWQSFEMRMRQRRIDRLLVRADVALEAGFDADAREALEEAEGLRADDPGVVELKTRLAGRGARPAAAVAPPIAEVLIAQAPIAELPITRAVVAPPVAVTTVTPPVVVESRAPSPEVRVPSPEVRVPSLEPRAPSPEPRVPSAEPRAPRSESRASSPEPRARTRAGTERAGSQRLPP